MTRNRAETVFAAALVAFLAWVAWEARQWDFRAQLFPLTIALPVLGLAALQLAISLWRGRASPVARPADGADTARRRALVRGLAISAWIFGFAAAAWLLGFTVGSAFAAFAFLRFAATESWKTAIAYAAATYLCLKAGFDYGLGIVFPPGVLQGLIASSFGGA